MNVNQEQYLTAEDAGVKIAVHTQSEPPLPDDYGIAVPTGKKAFICVKQLNTNDQTRSKKFKYCRSKGHSTAQTLWTTPSFPTVH